MVAPWVPQLFSPIPCRVSLPHPLGKSPILLVQDDCPNSRYHILFQVSDGLPLSFKIFQMSHTILSSKTHWLKLCHMTKPWLQDKMEWVDFYLIDNMRNWNKGYF